MFRDFLHDTANVRQYWDRHADRDPLWAILSEDDKRGRRWDLNAFMATGEREVSLLIHEIASLGVPLNRETALDFGCGVGRLTQALARRFERVVGVDISQRMVDLARAVNKHGSRVNYFATESLRLDGQFDFVYSSLVLQHLPPDLSEHTIGALVRSLRPEGLLVFQLPAEKQQVASGPKPMPADAYRAALGVSGSAPALMEPRSRHTLHVHLRNGSAHPWRAAEFGRLRVGNHWRLPDGSMVVQDDGRADVPDDLLPGAECVIRLEITAPSSPGVYGLEVDAVHEGVTWFGDRNSSTVRLNVQVGQPAPPLTADTRSDAETPDHPHDEYSDVRLTELLPAFSGEPQVRDFPMSGIPATQVREIVASAGGVVVHTVPDDHAKPEWTGFKYFVRRL